MADAASADAPSIKRRLIPDINDFNGSVDDIDKGVHDYIWSHHRRLYIWSWVVSIAACIVLFILEIIYLAPLLGSNQDARAYALPLLTLTWPAAIYAHFRFQMQQIFMQQIALALGLSYVGHGDPASVAATELAAGHDKTMEDVMVGLYEEQPMRIYNYTRTIGYGRGSHTDIYTVFELTLSKSYPDIRLCPSLPFLGGRMSTSASGEEKRIELEGDFNNYFSLYAPQGYDVQIRVIFQPDIMAQLIDKYQKYTIEIYQDKLYVLAPSFSKKSDFLATHDLIDSLFTKMVPYIQEAAS